MPYVKNYRYLLSWYYENESGKGIGTGYFTLHKKSVKKMYLAFQKKSKRNIITEMLLYYPFLYANRRRAVMKRDRVLKARDVLREHCKDTHYNCSACIFKSVDGCKLYGVPHTWKGKQYGRTGTGYKVTD